MADFFPTGRACGVTAVVEGFFAFVGFGWGQAAAPSWLVVPLAVAPGWVPCSQWPELSSPPSQQAASRRPATLRSVAGMASPSALSSDWSGSGRGCWRQPVWLPGYRSGCVSLSGCIFSRSPNAGQPVPAPTWSTDDRRCRGRAGGRPGLDGSAIHHHRTLCGTLPAGLRRGDPAESPVLARPANGRAGPYLTAPRVPEDERAWRPPVAVTMYSATRFAQRAS